MIARDELITEMHQRLTAACTPILLNIIDDSAQHAGHAGARLGGGHFTVEIVAEAFKGLSLVKRHQLVYQALGNYVGHEIHALSIIAKTPEEMEK